MHSLMRIYLMRYYQPQSQAEPQLKPPDPQLKPPDPQLKSPEPPSQPQAHHRRQSSFHCDPREWPRLPKKP